MGKSGKPLSYKGSIFHRASLAARRSRGVPSPTRDPPPPAPPLPRHARAGVIPQFMLQGGDFTNFNGAI